MERERDRGGGERRGRGMKGGERERGGGGGRKQNELHKQCGKIEG